MEERRLIGIDRRRVPRGGRRADDPSGRSPLVLLVDGYEPARQPCAQYLDLFNFEVAEAATGEEAIQRIVAKRPQVILTEWTLPAMPAVRFLQWLGENPETRDIPVIVACNRFDSDIVAKCPVQIASVLIKPFGLDEMLEVVRRALRGASSVKVPV